MTANRAMAQGRVAGRHAAQAATPPYRPETVIHAIYTEPAVAQVGDLQGPGLAHVRLPLAELLKMRIMPEATGFFELSYDPRDGRVRGAVAVGPQAGEMVLPAAQAISMRATVSQLASLYPAHPTAGEIACVAARRAAAWRD
jgi:dihydrolipoamide dehydrogenase